MINAYPQNNMYGSTWWGVTPPYAPTGPAPQMTAPVPPAPAARWRSISTPICSDQPLSAGGPWLARPPLPFLNHWRGI